MTKRPGLGSERGAKPHPASSQVSFEVDLRVTVQIDQRVIDSVDNDEWRSRFYNLRTPREVAEHLAYNLVQGRSLTSLDGFSDQPEDGAALLGVCCLDSE